MSQFGQGEDKNCLILDINRDLCHKKVNKKISKNEGVDEELKKVQSKEVGRSRAEKKLNRVVDYYCKIQYSKNMKEKIKLRDKLFRVMNSIKNDELERNTKEFYISVVRQLFDLVEFMNIECGFDWIRFRNNNMDLDQLDI